APPAPAPAPAPKKPRWLLIGCGTFLAILLLGAAVVMFTLWWIQRPIKPVVLSAPEKAAVDQKLARLGDRSVSGTASVSTAKTNGNSELEARYTPGSKVVRLTEREMNGLLNANTGLGDSVRLEFDRDAINAYLAMRIPQD